MRDITPRQPQDNGTNIVTTVRQYVGPTHVAGIVGFSLPFFLFGFGFIVSGICAGLAVWGMKKFSGGKSDALEDYYSDFN